MGRTKTKITVGVAVLGLAAAPAFASTSHKASHHSPRSAAATSRLDDGQDLLPKASITEQQAIETAQSAASGRLNEVDLEYRAGTLVFNVDVGSHDVKVDASSGHVLAVDQDD